MRSYGQYCALAKALDVVGERWSLLIVRELLLGPKRYTDLLDGLPGIATNLLSARLRELESLGIVGRRLLPPPAGSAVYELTDRGRRLEPAVLELGRWGAEFLDEPTDDTLRPGWFFVSLRSTFRRDAAPALERFEFHIDGDVFHVLPGEGDLPDTGHGPAHAPDVTVTVDVETFVELLAGRLSPDAATASGAATVEGDPAALGRFVAAFAWDSAVGAPI
jgi:DNA-binding HxlR family transcriptional regulator